MPAPGALYVIWGLMFEVGSVIQTQFLVEEVITGGMSVVYICSIVSNEPERNTGADSEIKRYAIKALPQNGQYSEGALDMFRLECLTSTTLSPHPYLLRMLGEIA